MFIQDRIRDILQCISVGIYGKESILSKVLLCAIAGESLFILGPPGTAKSLIARRLKSVFKDAKAFEKRNGSRLVCLAGAFVHRRALCPSPS